MTFSSDEIKTDVSKIVQGSPTYSRDGFGGRNVKERFEQTRELVNSVMLYEPDSVYYLIYKAAIKTRALLKSVLSTMDDLTENLDGMAVPSKAVKDTTALADAKAALGVISGALARRGSISAAEYTRYERAADRALSVYADSTKRTYTPFSGSTAVTDVVTSSAEAASDLQTNMNTFRLSYQTLLSSVDDLLAGFGDYDHTTVVTSVAAKQMARITDEMESLESKFNEATPDQRTKTARVDVLSLITNKSSVKALSRARLPGDPKLLQTSTGSSLYRMTAYGTGTAASMQGDGCGPWPIEDDSILEFDFGGTAASVPLVSGSSAVPGIKPAQLTGFLSEVNNGFRVGEDLPSPTPLLTKQIADTGTYTINGTNLYLVVDGTKFTIAMTSDWDATDVASAINTAAGTHVTASPIIGGGNQRVSIAYNNGSPPDLNTNRYMQIATGPANADDLGPWSVGTISGTLSTGWDANNELRVWHGDNTSESTITLPVGTYANDFFATTSSIVSAIDAISGLSAQEVDGKIEITSDDSGEGSIIRITTAGLSGDNKSASMLGAETLGFYKDQESRESDVRSSAIVNVLNSDMGFAAKATAELVSTTFLSSKGGYRSDTNKLSVDFTEEPDWGSWPSSGAKISIESGENRGVYGVTGVSTSGSYTAEFTLDRNLRDQTATAMRVKFYTEFLKITAKGAGTSDAITITTTDPDSAHVIVGLPASAYGTVNQVWVERNDPVQGWVSANIKGLGIKIGDVILLEDDSLVATVTGINSLGLGVIDVTAVSPSLSLSAFRIESVAANNHTAFTDSLQEWRDSISTRDESLVDLEKSINFLLSVNNPPRGRVQTASTELQSIRDLLEGSSALSGILSSLSQTAIPAVDRALDVMSENGQDRARNLITSAKFSDYNSTNYKTASSSGAMMDAASKVATSDVVEPTKTRREFTSEISKLRSSTWDDVDPKYNFGDVRPDSAPIHLDYFSEGTPRNS